MWVAVGAADDSHKTILHSSDGITWTKSSGVGFKEGGLAVGGGWGVAYNPVDKMWVAVGVSADDSPGTILHSSDGITWIKSSSEGVGFSAGGAGGGRGVAYNPIDKMWVAVGKSADAADPNKTILHSTDGITWTESSGVGFGVVGVGYGVAYNPVDKMWVAVGVSADSPGTILHSSDGITWTESSGGVAFNAVGYGGYGVAYNPVDKMWVAVGLSNDTDPHKTILRSSDGITWTKSSGEVAFLANGAGFGGGGRGVAYNPIDKMWVAVGKSATDTKSSGTILHSSDGITWTESSSEGGGVAFNAAVGAGGSGVAYNPVDKMWVAVGRSAETTDIYGTILHSSDGITWTKSSGGVAFLAAVGGGVGVAYTPGLVVPIGELNRLTV